MLNIIYVAIGGAIGSVFRYLTYELVNYLLKNSQNSLVAKIISSFPASFPFATFFVNVFGSILAGFIYYFVIKDFENFSPDLKNIIFLGFLGGFTTFSAFSLDFFRLINAGQIHLGIIYILVTVILAILAVFFGFNLAKLIF